MSWMYWKQSYFVNASVEFHRTPMYLSKAMPHGTNNTYDHDDVIKWKHFPRYWPFVRGIHRSSLNSPHKGQWRGALIFSLIWASINGWVNNGEAGDLRRHRTHYDVIEMPSSLHRLSSTRYNNVTLQWQALDIHNRHLGSPFYMDYHHCQYRYKVWDQIVYLFSNFDAAVEVYYG